MVAQTQTGVDARIKGEGHFVPRILHRDKTCRERESFEQDVMFCVEGQVRAVETVFIFAMRIV